MTLPIQPGPFSFLAGAGQALGAFGQARTAEEHYQNALELQRQQAALQNAAFLQRILDPSAFAAGQPGGQALAQAGVAPIAPGQIYTPLDVQKAKGFQAAAAGLDPTSTQGQQTFGVATKGQATQDEATAARAQVVKQAFANLTDEQAKAVEGVVSPDVAKLMNDARAEQLRTTIMTQDPIRTEAFMQEDIAKGVRKRYPNDPTFARIADYAKVGALGYLTAQIDAYARENAGSRALNTERVRTVNNIFTQSTTAYRAAIKDWTDGLQKEINNATGVGGPAFEKDPEEATKIVNRIVKEYKDRNPMPTQDFYLKQSIDAMGMDEGDFKQGARDLLHIADAQSPQSADPFQAVLRRHAQHPYTLDEIEAAVKAGDITPEQGQQLKNSLLRTKP